MVSVDGVRVLTAEALSTGRRQDTGRRSAALPQAETHFVVLLKPEVLTAAIAGDACAEVLRVLAAGDCEVVRCAVLPARDYLARGHLLLHYPRLHRVAADGRDALSTRARCELTEFLASVQADGVLGAFAALAHDPSLSPAQLDERCRQAGIAKLGAGSYVSALDLAGKRTAVLNGFLPALKAAYVVSGGLVAVLECHSPREIADLRSNLLGGLDPGAAPFDSLRGVLHGLLSEREGVTLSEGRNGAHLSAGHLEGMFQAWLYFAAADGGGLEATALGATLGAHGMAMPFLASLASDPNVAGHPGETVAPFGCTEGLERDEVILLAKRWAAREEHRT